MPYSCWTQVAEPVRANRSGGNSNPATSRVLLNAQLRGVSLKVRGPPGKVKEEGGHLLWAARSAGRPSSKLTMARLATSAHIDRLYSWYNLGTDWGIKVRGGLAKRKAVLERALAEARKAQKDAPGAMESYSDTTKSEMEKLVTALELDLKKLAESEKKLTSYTPKYFEMEGRKIVLVPEGMGGDKIGEVLLVSETTPLGKKLLGGGQ
ncbi:MAG: hypothetical protein UX80_C0022G0015 [Candidatus Amesbacteria bacterium GW2011_GWA2_47_11b]|uniref:Uncharacterized protein n=1 Tax=Candidatus Amesbacteria bacterium GW2011_GWA2_47_11b TaxID=1618358 RepID=A0A0G1UHP3_9BACT|nr:MAG: hypothetical protein UX80_C0022G0015 [Candidatus Amesbacteria bacterium GW2011_GWA2_47_11b]